MVSALTFGMEALMDRQALRRQLRSKLDSVLERAMDAVEAAPDGRWIAGSEWAVREAFAELTKECFQAIVQARIDADSAASGGSFSPGRRRAAAAATARDAAVQGRASAVRAQRRR